MLLNGSQSQYAVRLSTRLNLLERTRLKLFLFFEVDDTIYIQPHHNHVKEDEMLKFTASGRSVKRLLLLIIVIQVTASYFYCYERLLTL